MNIQPDNIYLGDCLEIMKQIPDKSIDCIITDPPYGLGTRTGTIGKKRQHKNNYESFNDTEENIVNIVIPAIHECLRIAKTVVVTPGPRHFCKYPQPDDIGCFYQPATCGMGKWGRTDMQLIFYYGKDPNSGKTIKFNSRVLTEKSSCNDHPCAKPINAWKWLVEKCTNEGDLILDPFLGSGTTAIACYDLKRRYIGIEKEPKYFEIANKRINEFKAQMRMF